MDFIQNYLNVNEYFEDYDIHYLYMVRLLDNLCSLIFYFYPFLLILFEFNLIYLPIIIKKLNYINYYV
jgi:hypothetical protein